MKSTARKTGAALLFTCALGSSHAQQPAAVEPPAAAPAPAPAGPAAPANSADEKIGFTWWNKLPEMIKRGNSHYGKKEFEGAENYYKDAQLEAPDQAAAAFNLGLAESKKGNYGNGVEQFKRALNLSGDDAALRSKSLYNLGLGNMQEAIKTLTPEPSATGQGNASAPALKDEDRQHAIRSALDSIDAFNGALKLNPNNEAAKFNKAQAQHLLTFASQPPPPPQQNPQDNSSDDKKDPQNQDQQNNNQQNNQKDDKGNDKKDQQKQDQNQQQDQDGQNQQQPPPKEDEKQDEQKDAGKDDKKQDEKDKGENQDDKDQSDQKPDGGAQDGSGGQAKPVELTPEQAREMLNLLGDQQNIVMKKGKNPFNRPEPKKDW